MRNGYRIQFTEIKPGGHHDQQCDYILGDRSDVVRYLSARNVLAGSVHVFENVGNLSDGAGTNIGGLGWNPAPVVEEVAEVPTTKRYATVRRQISEVGAYGLRNTDAGLWSAPYNSRELTPTQVAEVRALYARANTEAGREVILLIQA